MSFVKRICSLHSRCLYLRRCLTANVSILALSVMTVHRRHPHRAVPALPVPPAVTHLLLVLTAARTAPSSTATPRCPAQTLLPPTSGPRSVNSASPFPAL